MILFIFLRDPAMEDAQIISVSTGTKCVNGEHMSVHGNSLNGESALDLSS